MFEWQSLRCTLDFQRYSKLSSISPQASQTYNLRQPSLYRLAIFLMNLALAIADFQSLCAAATCAIPASAGW